MPLSHLHFCEDCHQIRCSRCVQDENICYYCPNCLFEVPTASVKSERNRYASDLLIRVCCCRRCCCWLARGVGLAGSNCALHSRAQLSVHAQLRCMRNCFFCPYCTTTLLVVSEESAVTSHTNLASITATTTIVGRYYLYCPTCRFDSRDEPLELAFERPTGIAAQIQKVDEQRSDAREFESLRDYFEKCSLASAEPYERCDFSVKHIGFGTPSLSFNDTTAHGSLPSFCVSSLPSAAATAASATTIPGSADCGASSATIHGHPSSRTIPGPRSNMSIPEYASQTKTPSEIEDMEGRVVEDLMTLTDTYQSSLVVVVV